MSRVSLFSILFAGLLNLSVAQATPENCIALSDDVERLACFDAAFGQDDSDADVELDVDETDPGQWNVRIETSEMTDETNVFLSVEADQAVNCGWNGGGRPTLFLRCMEDTTSIIFATDCHMTSSRYDNYGDVTYRLDDETPRTRGFTESTNTDHWDFGTVARLSLSSVICWTMNGCLLG